MHGKNIQTTILLKIDRIIMNLLHFKEIICLELQVSSLIYL